MAYLKKCPSLQEISSVQIAISLCQRDGFKEIALRLEKPTCGAFTHRNPPQSFMTDSKSISVWEKMKKDAKEKASQLCYALRKYYDKGDLGEEGERWDAAVDEQCQRLTERIVIPPLLKPGVHAWMNRIALEYSSYCRRQEVLFGISRHLLMDVLNRGDWTEDCRLAEEKIAERLLRDERLTVLERYRIACVYCLPVSIPQLWKELTHEEKQSITGNGEVSLSRESNSLVLLWSYHMDGHRDNEVTGEEERQWSYAVKQAVCHGSQAILMPCWKMLSESKRQRRVIDMALLSVRYWQRIRNEWSADDIWRENVVSNGWPGSGFQSIERFNLPSYYSRLVCFFLSEMNEKRQLEFFKEAFRTEFCDSFLECFLDWPHQEDFLPTMNRLWGTAPEDKYVQCLLTLAGKYSQDYKGENRYYDYRSLLWRLWEETPEMYKRYVFCDKIPDSFDGEEVINEGKILLLRLLGRSPFGEEDEKLFKKVWRDFPQEERTAMMRSQTGEDICSVLTREEKWSFANGLLEECLPKEEIPSFKKRFIQSKCGRALCLYTLEENREKLLEDLIDWSFVLDTEKTKFKYELIDVDDCLQACKILLNDGEINKVERMINFCLSSDQVKGKFRVRFGRLTCHDLIHELAWEQMDKILAWCFDTEEKIRDFKKNDLFSFGGKCEHYNLVCIQRRWEEVECLYKWFCLSPDEIKRIKKEAFEREVIQYITNDFYVDIHGLIESLHWCLTDEEMVISLKRELEERYFEQEMAKKRLDYLANELIYGFRKEVQGETSIEGGFVKRSLAVKEDETSSPRKRFK